MCTEISVLNFHYWIKIKVNIFNGRLSVRVGTHRQVPLTGCCSGWPGRHRPITQGCHVERWPMGSPMASHRLLDRTEIVKWFIYEFNNSVHLSMKASKKFLEILIEILIPKSRWQLKRVLSTKIFFAGALTWIYEDQINNLLLK